MLFPNSNREVLSGSRIRMRTAGRGQDVRPEKTSLFESGKKTYFTAQPSTSTGNSPRL